MTVGIAVATTVASSAAMKTHSTSARTVRRRFAGRFGPVAATDASDAPLERSLDLEQLDLEDERRVRRDHGRKPALAVREVRRDRQLAQRAHLHARDALIPPLDDAPAPEREAEALPAVARAV